MAKRYAIIGDLIAENLSGRRFRRQWCRRSRDPRTQQMTLRSRVGTDAAGDAVMREIKAARVHPKHIDRVDGATSSIQHVRMVQSRNWSPNILMTKDAVLDIYDLSVTMPSFSTFMINRYDSS